VGSAILNLSLALVLVPRVGAIGAAYALLVNGIALLLTINFAVQRRLIKLPVGTALRRIVARPLAAAAGLLVFALLIAPHVRGALPVIAAVVAGFAIYGGLVLLVGVFDQQELSVARGLMTGTLSRLRPRRQPLPDAVVKRPD
jgi:O-antigen/teichoic acid export membrane protein